MRFLKQKIARASHFAETHSPSINSPDPPNTLKEREVSLKMSLRELPKRVECPKHQNKRRPATGNNVMKNYCRALINFGLSPQFCPYFSSEIENELSYERFIKILTLKRKVNCIKGLRRLLLQDVRDSREISAFKVIFRRSCEVFLKYFCVNWIYNSRVGDRLKHLSYRGKILRRVRNPELFTHLEDFVTRD